VRQIAIRILPHVIQIGEIGLAVLALVIKATLTEDGIFPFVNKTLVVFPTDGVR